MIYADEDEDEPITVQVQQDEGLKQVVVNSGLLEKERVIPFLSKEIQDHLLRQT